MDTSATKSAVEAEYVAVWAKHIENIGTRYFTKKHIDNTDGLLILQVILDHRGKVIRAEIHSSSGSADLDKGALEILKVAASSLRYLKQLENSGIN